MNWPRPKLRQKAGVVLVLAGLSWLAVLFITRELINVMGRLGW